MQKNFAQIRVHKRRPIHLAQKKTKILRYPKKLFALPFPKKLHPTSEHLFCDAALCVSSLYPRSSCRNVFTSSVTRFRLNF